MFARIATFEGVDSQTSDETYEEIRAKAEPIVEALAGWQGATQLIDRRSGKTVVIHYFDTEENMEAAESTFEDMPRRLGEVVQKIAGGRTSVEKYEVLADRRGGG
jgi:exonuclease VII small subunit